MHAEPVIDDPQLYLHEQFRYRVDYVGDEHQPVLIVENFLANAEQLIDYCAHHCAFNTADLAYPGVRMAAPKSYLRAMLRDLGEIIYSTFGITSTMIHGLRSDYSMVVTPPTQLRPQQRMPHVDSTGLHNLACVHYLCNETMGGTSLYRHRQTGYQTISDARKAQYLAQLSEQLQQYELPMAYINGSTELFEQLTSYEACFNRVVMYRSNHLHSGNIASTFNFDPNPRTGRLTLNTFVHCQE
ncbi:hypothetical protein CBP51_13735 [Cellvibrio mixtus]|uniref:TauD/TfdA-like domain-containing protein n=1 Tax=Cellvibrio mixtus TaxID=39650 RepID=A0A266Q334_9GAMM|nr:MULTISPECIES: DUF6445 family protein [Cellvibrio]AQT58799.1 hypothetical protein B0D95_00860 [Cellvibrio sp. PSBB023]OZY84278.1 hypothetical protein CBP51_13735 [Cellvibrio mixtus]